MPKASGASPFKYKKLFDALPKEFNRKKAVDVAKEIGISPRSADGHLKTLQAQGLIIKQKHGSYIKFS